jgi:hypothetical protein
MGCPNESTSVLVMLGLVIWLWCLLCGVLDNGCNSFNM